MFRYISRLIDDPDPVIIMPYGGYATNDKIHAQARVLEDEGLDEHSSDSISGNLFRSFKRFETDEKENVKVYATWEGGQETLVSDNEGYIYLNKAHGMSLNHERTLWIPITYKLNKNGMELFSITYPVMKPSPTCEFGVISDMDETVLHTGLDSILKWKVLVNTLGKHSDKRLPLEGAQELYTLLHGGSTGYRENPFFYLSNSPWNLYDYLIAFLEKNNFPRGTLLLRDIGLENKKRTSFLEGNKFIKIKHILESYPKMNFILIGDAEDLDPQIYSEIAKLFPNRILSIYIRNVRNRSKTKNLTQYIKDTKHVEMLQVDNTEAILEHAKLKGFIID